MLRQDVVVGRAWVQEPEGADPNLSVLVTYWLDADGQVIQVPWTTVGLLVKWDHTNWWEHLS